MRFGVSYANAHPRATPDDAMAFARAVEENGFDSLWTVEHVVVPDDYGAPYPYSRDGRMPGETLPIPDPLVWLGYVAAGTTTVRLATGVLILPQRNPLLLAKEVATLDVLSGGRALLGIGVGWLPNEFAALGVAFAERGARADEYVAAMRALWRDELASFDGRFFSFERVRSEPKPAQAGGVPIVVGGHSEAAARRAGRLGDGYFPNRRSPEENERMIGVMRDAAREAGRDPGAIEITCGLRRPEWLEQYRDMGVSRLLIAPPPGDLEEVRRVLGEFSERVIQRA